MALILLRHTEPDIEPGICYGRSDIDARMLDDRAIAQLIASFPKPIARIDTSPLIRCSRLAERIAQSFGLVVHTDPRLAEIDFGRWEMHAWDTIPRHEIDLWAADVSGARPHGGESVAEMTDRVGRYLDEQSNSGDSVLAVAHLGVARCAYAALGRDNPFELTLGYGEFLIIDPTGSS